MNVFIEKKEMHAYTQGPLEPCSNLNRKDVAAPRREMWWAEHT